MGNQENEINNNNNNNENNINNNSKQFLISICQKQDLQEIRNSFGKTVNVNYKLNSDFETALHIVCQSHTQNSLEIVKYLISKGADVNAQTRYKETPLHIACQSQNSFKVIKYLIEKGADVNARNEYQEIALHFICQNHRIDFLFEAVEYLVEEGSDINAETIKDETALHFICQNRNSKNLLNIITYLIQNGADINAKTKRKETPLHFACQFQHFNIIKYLIENGADINAKTFPENTTLHIACQFQHFNVISYLVEKGADINAQNEEKSTPLIISCRKNQMETIKYLIGNGADINAKTKRNETALHFACQFQYFNVIKYLIENGADLNCQNQEKKTPLYIACENKSLEIIKYLIEKGADVNARNAAQNSTILHFVCGNENPSLEIIKYLVEKGIDINAKNNQQETALHYICRNEDATFELVNFLIDLGMDLNAESRNSETPLHNAFKRLHSLEIIKLLVEKGANIHDKTRYDETVLHFACQNINISFEIIKYLIESGADINAKTESKHHTPLHFLCQNKTENSFEIVKFLVDSGADVYAQTIYNQNLLHLTCKNLNGLDIIQNTKTENEKKLSCIDSQYEQNLFQIIKYLIEKGVHINSRSNLGETPLSIAARQKNQNAIKLLMMNDANIFDLKIEEITNEILDSFPKIYSLNEDFNKFLKSNENFFDLQIESNDSFKFQVHKLILLSRLNNDQLILQKFINICKNKPKEVVQFALNFLYSGFTDYDDLILQFEKLKELKKEDDLISGKRWRRSYWEEIKEYQQKWINFQNSVKDKLKKENEMVSTLFEEIGIEREWIQTKSGRRGILKDFEKLYEQNETKDFTIIVEEKEIKVHKLILIIRSDLYKGMFQLNVEDSSNQVHDYSKKSFETIQELIYFLYHDKFENEIKKEIFEEFEDLKDYYQLNQNSIIDLILN